MKLIINGEKKELDVQTLSEVVDQYELQKGLVVTEIDGKIIDRKDWEETKVRDGMKIEIVHFVGGG